MNSLVFGLDGYVQTVKIYNTELSSEEVISSSNENIPCLTDSCNILTPKGYVNVTFLKEGDVITTPDNRNLPIIKKLKTISKIKSNKIKAHQYGNNKPIIDTFISDNHRYKINGKWLIPKKQNLDKNQTINNIYYHIKLPNYSTDHLIVNELIMESWNGK